MVLNLLYTIVLKQIGITPLQGLVLLATAAGAAADGAITMMLTVLSSWIQCEFGVNTLNTASMNALLFVGQLFGMLAQGIFFDWFGRKATLQLFFSMVALVNVLFALSPTFSWILYLRTLLGFFLGPLVVAYAIDFFLRENRSLAAAAYSSWSIGTLVGIGISTMVTKGWLWRSVMFLMSIFPITAVLVLLKAPESPRYLYVSGQEKEAKKIMYEIFRSSDNPQRKVDRFFSSPNKKVKTTKVREVLSHPKYRILMLLQCILRFTVGITYFGVASLSVSYFQQVEESTTTSSSTSCSACTPLTQSYYIAQLYFAVGDFLGNILMYVLVDRIGRRTTLIALTSSGAVVMLLLLLSGRGALAKSVVFLLKVIVSAILITVSQAFAEAFPTSVRGSLIGLSCCFMYSGCIISPFLSDVLIVEAIWLPPVTMAIVLAVACVALLLVSWETRDVELEDF